MRRFKQIVTILFCALILASLAMSPALAADDPIITPPKPVLATPTGLVFEKSGIAKWEPVEGANYYYVRAMRDGHELGFAAEVTTECTFDFSNHIKTPGAKYTFKVCALGKDYRQSEYAFSNAINGPEILPIPKNIKFTGATGLNAIGSWDAVPGAVAYDLILYKDLYNVQDPIIRRIRTQETSCDFTEFILNGTYYYHIKSVGDGKYYLDSDYSIRSNSFGYYMEGIDNPSEYKLTVIQTPGGTISPGSVTVEPGGDQYFQITPAEGYRLKTFLIDDYDMGLRSPADELNGMRYHLTNVWWDHTITAVFEYIGPIQYPITVDSNKGGKVTVSADKVLAGESVDITITPDEGYEVRDVKINGRSVGAVTSYRMEDIQEGREIVVTFKLKSPPPLEIRPETRNAPDVTIKDEDGNEVVIKNNAVVKNEIPILISDRYMDGSSIIIGQEWTVNLDSYTLTVDKINDSSDAVKFICLCRSRIIDVELHEGDTMQLMTDSENLEGVQVKNAKAGTIQKVYLEQKFPGLRIYATATENATVFKLIDDNTVTVAGAVRYVIDELGYSYGRVLTEDGAVKITRGGRRTVKAMPDFKDVKESNWFYKDVSNATKLGIMIGTAADQFEPNAKLTRAMAATILYRLAGEPKVEGSSGFSDVPAGKWYSEAVTWAAQTKIVEGMGSGKFSPNGSLTRDQFATMMKRYAEHMKYPVLGQADLSAYKDAAKVRDWAKEPLQWTVIQGLLTGKTETTLNPQDTTTRAEVSTIIIRFLKTIGG